MKKIATLVIITCGIIFSIHSQTWVNLNSSSPEEIITSVTESNNNIIKVKFETKGFYSEIVRANDLIYHRLSVPGMGRSHSTGLPELPLIRQMIAIPECSDISITCQTIQETVLDNYNVYPSPGYQVVTNPDSTYVVIEVFDKNQVAYERNSLSPSDNLISNELGYFRNQKYTEVEVSPFRYNPATQKLYIATELEITINLINATGSASSNLGIFNNVATNTMLNYISTNMTAEENDMRLGGGSVKYIELQTPQQANSIQADNSMTKQTSGEFYSRTGWLTPSYETVGCLAHFTEHGKNVEMPYTYNTDATNEMHIGDIIPDCTPGVVYNHDDKLYRTMDYGQTWVPTNSTTNSMNGYWVFKNDPGTVLERNPDGGMSISYDYGETFEITNIPFINSYAVAGWHIGEFFKLAYTDDWELYLTHSLDFNQTADTTYLPQFNYFEMTAGATDGELYVHQKSYDMTSYTVFFSLDYGHTFRPLITIDSITEGGLSSRFWKFAADSEPGVFHSITKEASMLPDKGTKIWVDYYRAYGDTLVTTYFHHFTHEWFDYHTPVMDCEIVDYDGSRVILQWNEPTLKPGEEIIGYQVFKGETLVSPSLITGTAYTDHNPGYGPSAYHVLAVYSDNDVSRSYNIVYCKEHEGINDMTSDENIAVFPNPTDDLLNIIGENISKIELISILGHHITTIKNSDDFCIDMATMTPGVYFLRISDAYNTIRVIKVLKH